MNAIHLRIILLTATFLASTNPACRSLPDDPRGFKRRYAEGLRLGLAAENDVIALAKRMGITRIAEISTRKTYREKKPVIKVTEKEHTEGQTIAHRTVEMYWTKWTDAYDFGALAKETVSEGSILARQPERHERFILTLRGNECIVKLDGVAIETGEQILTNLLDGNIRFRKTDDKDDPHRLRDFTHLQSIRWEEKRELYRVTFHLASKWSVYHVSIAGREIVVHEVVTMLA